MRPTNLTFCQTGDEIKLLTTNEVKLLSEVELRTLSIKYILVSGQTCQAGARRDYR